MTYLPTTFEIIFDSWGPRDMCWSIRLFTADVENDDGTQGREWDVPGGYCTKDLASADARAIIGA